MSNGARQQLPPQIKKMSVRDRTSGKAVVRYQVTVDAGVDPETGKRRQIRRRFTSEKDARTELAKVQGGVTSGEYVHPSKLTVDQACEAWLLSKHALKPSTLRGHRVSLQPLRDELGTVPVQKLSKADLDGLVGRLRKGDVRGRRAWSARSCNYMLYLCSAVLADQVSQGNVVRNVASLVDRVAGDAQQYRTLTEAEVFQILDHDCRDRHLWTLALYGLRRGEIAGLKWSSVNLTDKPKGSGKSALPAYHVRVEENRVVVGRTIESGTPKSVQSRRSLPMPPEVVDVLKAARKRQSEERLRFGEGYSVNEYVSVDETGKPYHPNLLTFRWGKMLDELKIDRVRLHDARHSCATLMHLRGVPIAVIAAWLGHASAAFTLSVYAHSQDEALQAAGASFSRVVTTRDTEAGP
ncbi:site-specific integrase [Mycobacterium sp. SMC-8]|uniref:site-specific integrase n=1 Tax=Mycobacterium sp. SMC-8 TaxID=2857060 RepID=UPI0021B30F12|nr:site-specific integrase [Mycobacterium sp. SMC-8]UXA12406.1 site-specific integrase [Mycobacterium sp. SMC-8]